MLHQVGQYRCHALDHGRLKTFTDLVDQQQAGPVGDGSGNQKHLLFATAQCAGALRKPLQQEGKRSFDLSERHADRPIANAEPDIFFHREVLKQRLLLGDVANSGAGDQVRRQSGYVQAVQFDLSGRLRQESHDAFQEGRLAHAVLAQQAENLTWLQFEIDRMQHGRLGVAAVQ